MSVHCLESGCIGKYTPLGPRDFPCAGILHSSALEIALGLRPRAISRASGCKIPALGKSLGPRGVYFPIHPSSRQCTDSILNPEHHDAHLHAEEDEDRVKLPPKQHADHLHKEEGEVQVLLNPKRQDGHLHAEEGEDQAQSRTPYS